jgi:receptor protein-tyrosine kinase
VNSLAERVADRLSSGHKVSAIGPAQVDAEAMSALTDHQLATPPIEMAMVEFGEAAGASGAIPGPARPVLQINFTKLQAAGFITPMSPRTSSTEAIRTIKRQLLKIAFPQERHAPSEGYENVVMVTSSMPGEGKTFVSLNLAMSFCAERDLFVLLIDGDGHRRSLGGLLGAKEDVGLVDILVDNSLQVGELIQRTNIPNLSFLSGGRPQPHAAELLASKQFGLLMQDIAVRYRDRMIIIDTPPVLASTEAVELSGHVGQTVVIVERDRTSKRQLERTLEMLEGGRNIGCVLNLVPPEETFADYEY